MATKPRPTPREREIIRLHRAGKDRAEIAASVENDFESRLGVPRGFREDRHRAPTRHRSEDRGPQAGGGAVMTAALADDLRALARRLADVLADGRELEPAEIAAAERLAHALDALLGASG